MNVLLIGSGGREHALAWKLAHSPLLGKLYAAPGNPGIARHAECQQLDVADHGAVVDFCRQNEIGLVVVGPEAPLVAVLADALTNASIKVFGPSAEAARLEGSKGFTKELCDRCGVPTAAWQRFNNAPKAKAYLRRVGAPIVNGWTLVNGAGITYDTSGTQWAPDASNKVQFENTNPSGVIYQDLSHNWAATDVYTVGLWAYDAGWRVSQTDTGVTVSLLQTDGTTLWNSGTLGVDGTVSGTQNNLAFTGTGHIHSFTVDASDFTTGTEGSELRLRISRVGGVAFVDNVSVTVVPEPSAILTFSTLAGLGIFVRRRRL